MRSAVVAVTAWLFVAALSALAFSYSFSLDYVKVFIAIVGARMVLNLMLIGTREIIGGETGGGSRTI